MTDKIPYDKTPYKNGDLLSQLENRGLNVGDLGRAKKYLEFIGYYRLSAYFLPYQNSKDHFKDDVKFNDILTLYIFDRKLKLILMDAIERIEVAIRSAIMNYMSLYTNDPHWFLTESHFDNYSPQKGKSFQHYDGFLSSIQNSLNKQKRINIRMTDRDFRKIQVKAIQEGIPYQSLISMLIHKFNEGKLKIL